MGGYRGVACTVHWVAVIFSDITFIRENWPMGGAEFLFSHLYGTLTAMPDGS